MVTYKDPQMLREVGKFTLQQVLTSLHSIEKLILQSTVKFVWSGLCRYVNTIIHMSCIEKHSLLSPLDSWKSSATCASAPRLKQLLITCNGTCTGSHDDQHSRATGANHTYYTSTCEQVITRGTKEGFSLPFKWICPLNDEAGTLNIQEVLPPLHF